MSNRLSVTLVAFAGIFAYSGVGAAESPYYKNVSDIEVETAVKGETFDKGMSNPFSGLGSKKSDCCCACPSGVASATPTTTTSVAASTTVSAPVSAPVVTNAPVPATTPVPTPSTAEAPRVKYILDGKPVYEDGAAPTTVPTATPVPVPATAPVAPVAPAPEKPKSTSMKANSAQIQMAVAELGTASWKDAQALLLAAGKDAIPALIDALTISDSAYNLGGHTKADAGRAPRQRTVAEVAAELLTDIVSNHSNYSGDLPGADQNGWREWWSKNGASVTFAGDVQAAPATAMSAIAAAAKPGVMCAQ